MYRDHKHMNALARRRALNELAVRHLKEFEILLDRERLELDLPPANDRTSCERCER